MAPSSFVEASTGHPLPQPLRELFQFFSAPEAKRRGWPANHRGSEDFAMEAVDRRYSILLKRFQEEDRQTSTVDDNPPSERAYRHLAEEMSIGSNNIGWEALRNKHSSWRNCHFPSA